MYAIPLAFLEPFPIVPRNMTSWTTLPPKPTSNQHCTALATTSSMDIHASASRNGSNENFPRSPFQQQRKLDEEGASTVSSLPQSAPPPLVAVYNWPQTPGKLYGHVDNPHLTDRHDQPIEDPVMSTHTSQLPGQSDLALSYARQTQIPSASPLQEMGNNTSNQGHFDNTGGDTLSQQFHHRAAYPRVHLDISSPYVHGHQAVVPGSSTYLAVDHGQPLHDNDDTRALPANPQGLDSTTRVGNRRCGLTACTNCYPSHSPTNGYYHPSSVSPTMHRYDGSFHFGTTSISPPLFQSHRAEVALYPNTNRTISLPCYRKHPTVLR